MTFAKEIPMQNSLLSLATVILICVLSACDRPAADISTSQDDYGDKKREQTGLPKNLDEAVAILMANMTAERRAYIEAGGEEFAFCSVDESILPSAQPFLDWVPPLVPRDQPKPVFIPYSPLQLFFVRHGIYHGEDMWLIINVSLSRKVRQKPIDLELQVAELRRDWAEQDIVAPLNLKCPDCGKEMHVAYEGEGVSALHPNRVYFAGYCPCGKVFYYYHKDGWVLNNTIKKANKSEQATPRKPSD